MSKDFSIKISDFKGIFQIMAKIANGLDDNDKTLNWEETSIFNKIRANNKDAEDRGYFFYENNFYDIQGNKTEYTPITKKNEVLTVQRPKTKEEIIEQQKIDSKHQQAIEKADTVSESSASISDTAPTNSADKIANMIETLAETSVNTKEISNIIKKISDKYNIPPEIIVTIIAIETGRTFKIPKHGKAGVMQITGITAKDMTVRSNVYAKMNETLATDTLYDDNKRKFATSEILKNCRKDYEYGTMVGLLCFEYKYKHPSKTSKKNYDGTNKSKLLNALGDYNVGERELYMRLAKEYLEKLGYDYDNVPFKQRDTDIPAS